MLASLVIGLAITAVAPRGADADPGATPDETTYAPTTYAPTTSTTVEHATTTVTEGTTETTEDTSSEEPGSVDTTQNVDSVEPGQSVSVGADVQPTGTDEKPLDPGTVLTAEVKVAEGDTAPLFTVNATVDDNGHVQLDVTFPDDTPPGVYLVILIIPGEKDADGNVLRRPRVAIATVVVTKSTKVRAASAGGPGNSSSDPESLRTAAALHTKGIDALIAKVVNQIHHAGQKHIVDQVSNHGATLSLNGTTVLLNDKPLRGSSTSSRGIAAALGLTAAAAGLLIIRRRNNLGAAR